MCPKGDVSCPKKLHRVAYLPKVKFKSFADAQKLTEQNLSDSCRRTESQNVIAACLES